jgi:hypothetical protein
MFQARRPVCGRILRKIDCRNEQAARRPHMKKAAFPAPERAHGNEKHNAIFDLSGAK